MDNGADTTETKQDMLCLQNALAETHRHIEAMYAQQNFDSPEIQRSANRAQELTAEIIRKSNNAVEAALKPRRTNDGM